jgi:hypothetical protein
MSDALIVLRRGPGYVAAGTMLLPLRGRAVGGRAGRPRADCLNAVRRWSLPIERAAVRPQQLLLDRSTTVRRRGRECRYRAQWSGGFPMAPHWPTVCRRVLQATREAPVGWRDAALPGLALQEQNFSVRSKSSDEHPQQATDHFRQRDAVLIGHALRIRSMLGRQPQAGSGCCALRCGRSREHLAPQVLSELV